MGDDDGRAIALDRLGAAERCLLNPAEFFTAANDANFHGPALRSPRALTAFGVLLVAAVMRWAHSLTGRGEEVLRTGRSVLSRPVSCLAASSALEVRRASERLSSVCSR
jgi:hypothetical protein